MPSLYQDAPPVPIRATAIHGIISMLVERRYKGDMPPWWESLRELLTALLDVGFTVSGRPSAPAVWNQLQAVAEASQNISAIETQINNRLSRSTRILALDRCAAAHLTYFLGIVDEWLRACEQYAQESKRYRQDFGEFQRVHGQLEEAAGRYVPGDVAKYWNLVCLFDTLERAEMHRALGVATPASSNDTSGNFEARELME